MTTDGTPVREDVLRRMVSRLSHRGPDDNGTHLHHRPDVSIGLGHRRLSIIDLSDSGRQPMTNENGTVWMVFNGEIYNFRPLRDELAGKGHRFRSHTDCEVVIHLYEEEGIGGVEKLLGMFAFALWDEKSQALYLCRDRLGIKPLVYAQNGGSITFASEIKGILQDPDIPREIDWNALGLYLTFNYIPAPNTIFDGIKKLRPGHILMVHNGKTVEKEYWNIDNHSPLPVQRDFITQKNELFELLEHAVRMRMIADVPLGAFLSGGIDSSIIVGLMARNSSKPVKTYSIGYKDMPMFDETEYAREVARLHHTDHHEIKLGSQDIIDVIPDVLDSFDEPFADSSALPMFVVSRETGRDVTVALSGDGGDELFAGYRMYAGERWYARYCLLPSFIRSHIIEPLALSFPDSRDKKLSDYMRRAKKFAKGARYGTFEERFSAWNEIFSTAERQDILTRAHHIDHHLGKRLLAERLNERKDDAINRMLYTDVKESLPGDMLKKVDAMSMLNALEVRVPFLDHRVCELAFTISGDRKFRKGKGKYILLETFKDILPPSLQTRPKWGFEIPVSRWLKSDLKYLIDEYLSREVVARQGIFHYDAIETLIGSFMSNRTDTSWQLWNLIVFQVWYSRYMEGQSP